METRSRIANLSPERRALLEKRLRQAESSGESAPRAERLAIVGIGCRFPGGASSPEAFWRLIADGTDAVTEVPPDRWDVDELFDPDTTASGKVSSRWGGFIDGVDRFDAALFEIAPREAAQMDPQQRLLLETAWHALEHAGQSADRLRGSATGVFVGVHSHSADYCWMQYGDLASLDAFSGTGTAHNFLGGRLSYLFDLQGPSIVVDTACSSSLVAMHLACQSIRARECEMAIVAGVNLMLSPQFTVAASRMHMLSPSGRCRTFDAGGDGFVRSEGCGVVVLKRLDDARRQGDRILAVVRGSAINQDGRTNGITAPSGLAQRRAIREALQRSGVEPEQVGYVEAHGTGTPLGDPIEVEALADTIGRPRADGSTVALGSVKSNIGHLEGGAGIAGVIKAVLCLHHKQIPPLVHFRTLNPHISLAGTSLRIPTSLEPWEANRPRIAGVSSFGWSGTNVHLLLEEGVAPERPADRSPATTRLLPLSARTPDALQALVRSWSDWTAGADGRVEIADAVDSAAHRRARHEHRAAVVFSTYADLRERLQAILDGQAHPDVAVGRAVDRGGIVFVFPGQGAQWLGMGRELYESEPTFRDTMDAVDASFVRYAGWSLVAELHAAADASRLEAIDVVQPLLFAVEVALAALWRRRGLRPDAVVGHSMGEVAAAYAAGALSLDDAVRVIGLRSRLMKRVAGRGAMAVVELSMDETAALLRPYEGRLSVAVCNSPTSTVISGDTDAVDQVLEDLDARDVFCRRIKVDVASHSPHVDALREDLVSGLQGLQPTSGDTPMYSTVRASVVAGTELGPEYWASNLRQPVLMGPAVERLVADGHTTFIEMSPHPILLQAIETCLRQLDRPGVTVPSLRREEGERAVMLSSAGRLYVAGYEIDWRAVNGAGGFADIPSYPLQRERFWLEALPVGVQRIGVGRPGTHPLLGGHVTVAARPGAHVWQFAIDPKNPRYVAEHRLNGTALLAASVVMELVLAAAAELLGDGPIAIHGLEFLRPLVFQPDAPSAVMQISAEPARDGRVEVKLFDMADGAARLLAQGAVAALAGEPAVPTGADLPGETHAGEWFYRRLDARGVAIGDDLATVRALTLTTNGVQAVIAVDGSRARDVGRYRAYPPIVDGALQLTALATGDEAGLYMPARCETVRCWRRPGTLVRTTIERTGRVESGGVDEHVAVTDESGALVIELEGLRLEPIDRAPRGRASSPAEDWVYHVDWLETAGAEGTIKHPSRRERWVVLADDAGIGAGLAEWLARKGQQVSFVPSSDRREPAAILDDALSGETSCRGIVFARALDAAPDPEDAAALERAFVEGTIGALRLVQAVAARDWAQAPRLWFVTRGALTPDDGEAVAIGQAPLAGFARVMQEEHQDLFGGLVDLEPGAGIPDSVAAAAAAIWDAAAPELACRGGKRYVPRLVRRRADAARAAVRPDGTYVVSGGFGAVGFAVARWLVACGARHLVLVGRTALPPRVEWSGIDAASEPGRRVHAVRELEAAGASVHVASVHLEDEASLSAWFDVFEREGRPPVRGVVHCAAIIEAALMARTTADAFLRVFRAKALGSFALERRLRTAPLDFFVAFSSIASLLPQPGQAAYAAANAFLDAFAVSRRQKGRPTLSVNWGVWRGLARAAQHVRRGAGEYEASGISAFDAREALDLLDRLVGAGRARAVVMPVDWTRYRAARGATAPPLVTALLADANDGPTADGTRAESFRDELQRAPVADRRARLEAHLQQHLARVLRVPLSRIEPTTPLGTLGLESMMTLEFRNRLQATLGLKLSATLVWNHPTVRALCTHLANRLEIALEEPAVPQGPAPAAAAVQAPGAGAQKAVAELAAETAALSEADALRALMGD
jgi:myxalamid-type polyketide synthase MxaD